MFNLSSWWRVVAVLVLLPCAGCVPNVVWLPDSSGFIFTDTDWPNPTPRAGAAVRNKILHYDLAKKTRHVIAADSPSTICPALSPDGKRIAFAQVTLDKGQPATLQVVVHDLQGKEVQRTQPFPWGTAVSFESLEERFPQLFWAPQGNKVLVFANKRPGICDLDRNQVVLLDTGRPMIHGTTPIRPDGHGFLMTKEGRRICFVDWEGKETPIHLAPAAEKLAGKHGDVLDLPAAVSWSRWEGDVAIATWKTGQHRIDTAKKTATFREPEPSEWFLEGRELQELYTFPDGKTKVAVLYLKSYRDFRDAGLPSVTVEILGPVPGQRRTLVADTPHCGLYPAPNKEAVAVRFFTQGEREQVRSQILVVNAKGETVAEIDTAP